MLLFRLACGLVLALLLLRSRVGLAQEVQVAVKTQVRPGEKPSLTVTAPVDGTSGGVRLVPWSVHIPHDEVVFETGKADVRPSEEAKLDKSYKAIVDAVA